MDSKFQRIAFLVLAILFLLIAGMSSNSLSAVDIGGELNLNTGLNYPAAGDLNTTFTGSAELEFYLPETAGVEPRLVMQGSLRDGGETDFNFKYLYLRRRLDSGHLTLGRQPVSWSYGAVINPFDYGFAIEDLAGETLTPGFDGARYFHSLGAGRSLQAVVSWPEYNSELAELGFGSRLRLPGQGYDLSFNLASHEIMFFEVVNEEPSLVSDRLSRAGITYSGDIGDFGLYGAAGYYHLDDSDLDDWVIQLGLDYSWLRGEYADRQVMLQGEYLRFIQHDLDMTALLGLALSGQSNEFGEMPGEELPDNGMPGGDMAAEEIFSARDLLVLNLSTNLDSFTNIGVAILGETENQNILAAPYYISDLGGGLELRLDGSAGLDSDNEINIGISAGLSYYF